jgi:hypothetical protein
MNESIRSLDAAQRHPEGIAVSMGSWNTSNIALMDTNHPLFFWWADAFGWVSGAFVIFF